MSAPANAAARAARAASAASASAASRVPRAAATSQQMGQLNTVAKRPAANALLALGLVGFVFGVYGWTRRRVKDTDIFAEQADELDEVCVLFAGWPRAVCPRALHGSHTLPQPPSQPPFTPLRRRLLRTQLSAGAAAAAGKLA